MRGIKTDADGRRRNIGFSVAGSLFVIVFLALINLTTGTRFLWFVFPSIAVLWWPLLTIFRDGSSQKILSLIGSLMTIALLFALNYMTSWNFPWFIFPSFAVLWWPIALFFGAGHAKTLSLAGSAVLIVTLAAINYIFTPSIIWFYKPAFAVIWWPLSVLLARPRTIKAYSIIGAAIIVAFLTINNVLESPFIFWAPLTWYPAVMWPICVFLGRRLGRVGVAACGSLVGIAYYTAINVLLFPGFPWAIFTTFALMWWPLAVLYAKNKRHMAFASAGAALGAAFFIAVNFVTTPGVIWFAYPVFALSWWPLSVYYFVYRRKLIK